jgi:hypothetical protein
MTKDREKLIGKFDKWLSTDPLKAIACVECANIAEDYHDEQLKLHVVKHQRGLLIDFLEMNNWFCLEDEVNARGVVDSYLKSINCV